MARQGHACVCNPGIRSKGHKVEGRWSLLTPAYLQVQWETKAESQSRTLPLASMQVHRQTHPLTRDAKHTLSCKNKPHTQKITIVLKTAWLRRNTYTPVEWDPKTYIFIFMVNWFLTRISSHLRRIKTSPWNKCYCISCVSICKQTTKQTQHISPTPTHTSLECRLNTF